MGSNWSCSCSVINPALIFLSVHCGNCGKCSPWQSCRALSSLQSVSVDLKEELTWVISVWILCLSLIALDVALIFFSCHICVLVCRRLSSVLLTKFHSKGIVVPMPLSRSNQLWVSQSSWLTSLLPCVALIVSSLLACKVARLLAISLLRLP